MNPAIQLQGICKSYHPGLLRREVPVLDRLDLTVEPGETYALIGPNGAGKTTAFRILLGLVRPDRGVGEILGRPLGDPEARRRLGFLPESPGYYPFLKVAELLELALRLSGHPERQAAVGRTLERFDLTSLADRPIRRLSKGQVQRVGIAQAAVHDPELLILDEPMSGLDPLVRSEVRSWIREVQAEGRTVVLASHVLADVEALADRVGLLRDGSLLVEGSAEELLAGTEEEVEIVFGLPGDARRLLDGLPASLEERSGLWVATVATGQEIQIGALLSRILAQGGAVRSVQRRRRSLESFYIRSLRQASSRAAVVGEG